MDVFVVTTKSTEEDKYGTIQFVRARLHGVFSDRSRADAIAGKYNGSVVATHLDKELLGTLLQYWENPGYVQD